MQIFETISELRKSLLPLRLQHTLGLVPTMGALHEGHLSLIRASKADNDYTICSIFVNPTQFNNAEDLKHYPRMPEDDLKLLEAEGCNAVFIPEPIEMYPSEPVINIGFGALETDMEGKHREGHFNGVGIVVAKLLNMVQPHRAYFGQKDLQQYTIIRQMVKDLSMDTQVVACPIVRETDGLAMSSRNLRLTTEERKIAPQIYKSLKHCANQLRDGKSVAEARKEAISFLDGLDVFNIEYIDIVSTETLAPISEVSDFEKTAICIAAHLGQVRLIDNLIVSDEV